MALRFKDAVPGKRVSDDSIAQLTRAMAAGEARAIERFYRAYFDAMLGMARRAARSRDEAFTLDVVHDAMLRIVRCVRVIETEPHLLNWTRLVVQSCALDRLRQESRRRQRERTTLPRDVAETNDEEIAWLADQIATLEPTLAELLRKRFSEGWTLARLASAYQTTTGQIDGRLRRAIAKLRTDAKAAFDE